MELPEIRAIRREVARLRIEHPDRDRYDDVWNKAIDAACEAITTALAQSQLTVPPVWRR